MKTFPFTRSAGFRAALTGTVIVSFGLTALAQPSLLLNGGFESGLADWTTADQLGSDGSFQLQSGSASPLSLNPVPVPPEGLAAAMTDSFGPGSHVLYQDFIVPIAVSTATIEFSLFINNLAGDFDSPGNLDFAGAPINQQVRVDLLAGGTDPFSVESADILLNLYQSDPGDPAVSGYDPYDVDVSAVFQAHGGETLRLRFAEVDNLGPFNLGVDQVSVNTQVVPESSSWLAMGVTTGLAAFSVLRRRIRTD